MMYNFELLIRLTWDIPDRLPHTDTATVPKETRNAALERDEFTCQLCGVKNPGRRQLFLHHIIPSGSAVLENLISLCCHCHSAVHNILHALGKWTYKRTPYHHHVPFYTDEEMLAIKRGTLLPTDARCLPPAVLAGQPKNGGA